MSLFRPVPPLYLAADVAVPLSPTAWRDYGKLLYWIFFFPQALRDYLAVEEADGRQKTLLLMSAILLLIVTAIAAGVTGLGQIQLADLDRDAAVDGALSGVPLGLLGTGIVYLWNRWQQQPVKGIVLGFATGITTTVLGMFALGELFDDTFLGMLSALGYGFVGGSSVGIIGNLATTLDGKAEASALRPALSAGIGGLLIFLLNSFNYSDVVFDLNFSQENLLAVLSGALTYYGGAQLGLRRPLDWLLGKLRLNWQLRQVTTSADASEFMRGTNIITDFAPGLEALFAPIAAGQLPGHPLNLPHVTRYAIPQLRHHLAAWLEDWDHGLDNANQLWRYTNQQPLVITSVQQALEGSKPSQQVEKVAKFVDKMNDTPWPMVLYPKPRKAVASQDSTQAKSVASLPRNHSLRQQNQREIMRRALGTQRVDVPKNLPLETPAQQAIAGFWHLQHTFMEESIDAFQKLPEDTLGKELQGITQSIQQLLHAPNLVTAPTVDLPERPKAPKRKATWDALEKFKPVVRYAWLYHQCKDEDRREAVKAVATYQLDEIVKDVAKIPQAERTMIEKLTQLWRKEFEQWVAATRTPQRMKPTNPFIFLEPLRGRKPFVGREAALKTLKQAGSRGSLQPVLLSGFINSGKSSLIQKALIDYNDDICFAIFNIPDPGNGVRSPKQVLWAMCQGLQRRVQQPLPNEQSFQADPVATTEKMVRDICYRFKTTLVLVVGNVDQLFMAAPKPTLQGMTLGGGATSIDSIFAFWWKLMQSIGNLSFVFVSQSDTLPDTPFTPVLKKIQVGNLERKEVLQLLLTPTADFTPLFAPVTVEHIYTLTGGQPFLVQLIASCVTDRFNQSLDKDHKLEPVFLIEDIDSILETETFGQFSRPYFQTVQEQLEYFCPGSDVVLSTLAQHTDGIDAAALAQILARQYTWSELKIILGFLQTQQVIKLVEERWQVVGELLRRAVVGSRLT